MLKTKKTSKTTDTARMQALKQSQAIIEFSPEGIILDANDNFLKVMGYSLQEIQGRHHELFVSDAQRNSPEYKSFWNRLASGETFMDSFQRQGKGGKEIWIRASYNPIKDSSGRVTRVMKLASDITDTKKIAINHAGQVEAINRAQAVIHFDLDGTVLDANDNFCKALGYELSEIKGRNHSMFVPGEEQGESYRQFWAKLRNGEHQTSEYRRIGKGNRDVYIQAVYNPILGSDGKPFRIIKFATDITAQVMRRKKREEVSREVDADLVRILEAVTQASSQISEASAAARETSSNVENVASGSEQLANSVEEISGQVQKAGEISNDAVNKVHDATRSIGDLSNSAQQIGQIVSLISDIAEQTNLLALNATIEAARAGEAGRGFAVVAGEVKALASQSAKATEDITNQINAVQNATSSVVSAIEAISRVIEQVNSISVSISGAVEEQACVTRDISGNMGDATSAVRHVSDGISGIAEAAQLIRQSTEKVKERSAQLAS